ncbi:hypothetical protein DTW90_30940 [Neorhizobium sp. P12A]|jgi:hypothetical protein|uniref:hypothetical protein n=1 Tax=Rhizobium/Agrobacterium group TaxID=227290 RepID=UPI00104DC4DA|nr:MULTISPECIES: hypothetical protein [Rhizobium/Agrobacterium group]KAA0689537.1 hypothetical protein DTW90_30940 [Neorhizobium sp. P12A]TCR92690.1 hypothetical protein EV561_101125 [Rhizobium sp. BK376]
MENHNPGQNNDAVDDILSRIEDVADWLKHEAQLLATPPEPEKKEVSVRRYRVPASVRLHRRPTYLLRGT